MGVPFLFCIFLCNQYYYYYIHIYIYVYIYILYIYIYKPSDALPILYMLNIYIYIYIYIYICSENSSYDKRCNELEVWLRERGYSDKLVRQQNLKARTHKRKDLLNNMKDKINDYQLVFNITYHPNFSKLKDTMSFLHLLFTPDQKHQKVFHKIFLSESKFPHFKKMKGFVDHVKNQDVKFVGTW